MLHYSCDRCKQEIASSDVRYVVKLEAFVAMDPQECEELDDDRDHLIEIQEILERLEDDEEADLGDALYQKRRYDLCSVCHREYMKNPVGRELASQIGFSDN